MSYTVIKNLERKWIQVCLRRVTFIVATVLSTKRVNALDAQKKAKKRKLRRKCSVTYILVLKTKNSLHALIVLVTRAKNMIREFSLKASSNGLERN